MRPIKEDRNPWLAKSMAAMERAALRAREEAIRTNTYIVVVREGKIVHVSADELRAQAAIDATD